MAVALAVLLFLAAAIGVGVASRRSPAPRAAALATVRALAPVVEHESGGDVRRIETTPAGAATGDVVRTSEDGVASIHWFDGSLTRLGPRTTFEVEQLRREGVTREVVGRLHVGRTFNRVAKASASGSRFEVRTAVAVAAVRGTVFAFRCERTTCTLDVLEGAVALTPAGASPATIGGGFRGIARPGEPAVVIPIPRDDPWLARNAALDREDPVDAPSTTTIEPAPTAGPSPTDGPEVGADADRGATAAEGAPTTAAKSTPSAKGTTSTSLKGATTPNVKQTTTTPLKDTTTSSFKQTTTTTRGSSSTTAGATTTTLLADTPLPTSVPTTTVPPPTLPTTTVTTAPQLTTTTVTTLRLLD